MKADFDKRVQQFALEYSVPAKEEDPQGWATFEGQVLEYLITYEMTVQKAEDYGISVTDAEVQSQIDAIINDSTTYNGDKDAFNADLAAHDLTLDDLKLNYRESMLMQKVYDKVTADVATPTDAQISAYYDANKSLYYVEETRVARHILIAPGGTETNPPSTTTTVPWGSSTTTSSTTTSSSTTTTTVLTDADWSAALATAQKVRALLAAGGDWTKLAAEYSDDPSSASVGGNLGTISKGQMVQEFEDAVFSLQLNEISQPIKTTYGYHVIQVTAITPANQKTLDESKDDISSKLVSDEKTAAWTKWIADTKAELGVKYQKGMEPTTSTSSTSTTLSGETTTTATGETVTTSGGTATTGGETATTAAGDDITTEAPTTTTAQP
jgi:foldase protein PrsA